MCDYYKKLLQIYTYKFRIKLSNLFKKKELTNLYIRNISKRRKDIYVLKTEKFRDHSFKGLTFKNPTYQQLEEVQLVNG